MVAGGALKRLISSLARDALFIKLPKPGLASRLKLLYVKYRLHLAGLLGRPVKTRFVFLGHSYHVSTHSDGALLQRVLLDTHSALTSLGLVGASGISAVDVGAHNGETVLAWSLFLNEPTIYAFEPDPVAFQNACLNTRALATTLERVGLSDRSGQQQLNIASGHGGAATYAHSNEVSVDPLQTEVARGDDLLAGREVDLIKIDVEGFERHVLDGLRTTLERCQFLIVEVSLQRPKDHAFHELAAMLAETKCELVATGQPHATPDGRQSAIDLCFCRAS